MRRLDPPETATCLLDLAFQEPANVQISGSTAIHELTVTFNGQVAYTGPWDPGPGTQRLYLFGSHGGDNGQYGTTVLQSFGASYYGP